MLTLCEVEREMKIISIMRLATQGMMLDGDSNNPDNIFKKILDVINGEKE